MPRQSWTGSVTLGGVLSIGVPLTFLGWLLPHAAGSEAPVSLGCANDRCYRLHRVPLTWVDARRVCRTENSGGRLVVIPDQATQIVMNRVIQGQPLHNSAWIGGRDRGSTWTYLNGAVYPGAVEMPHDTSSRCAYLFTNDAMPLVAADNCDKKKEYLCDSRAGDVRMGWTEQNWQQANIDCAERSMWLPLLTDKNMVEVGRRLYSQYGSGEYWIGVCKQGWIWEELGLNIAAYRHFEGVTPFCTDRACLTINNRGYWINDYCHNKRPFICEYENLETRLPAGENPDGAEPGWLVPATANSSYEGAAGKNKGGHNHGLLIGIIVGLVVVITVLIVLLALLIISRRRAEKREKATLHAELDNIYAEIPEPGQSSPAAVPNYNQPGHQNIANENRETPTVKVPPSRPTSNTPVNDYDDTAAVPATATPAPANGHAPGRPVGATGPYAVSYIAVGPKQGQKSDTLSSVQALPLAPTAPPLSGTSRKPPPRRKEPVYLAPKDETKEELLKPKPKPKPKPKERPVPKDRTSAHGHGRKEKGRGGSNEGASVSLMLEENDLYSDNHS